MRRALALGHPAFLCLLLATACGPGDSAGDAGPGPVKDAGTRDSGANTDAGTPDSSADGGRGDAGAPDAGRDAGPDGGTPAGTLSARYPGDLGIENDPSVLFHDDFESGWGKWDAPMQDTRTLTLETGALAHAGNRYLRSTVTEADLQANQYISASPRFAFGRRVDTVYWRFYARFPDVAPNPHHWIRLAAGNATWGSSGLANTVPPGDAGFWFDFDINDDDVYNFYVYWYAMRSGRCNDGSATPGCAGDQGTTYYYGNVFRPKAQTPYPRDTWTCLELAASVNQVGRSDGWLQFWVDGAPVGRFAPGEPVGTWLRATFHEGGCAFSACTPPAPFEGFDFRTSNAVRFKGIFLDAYYERDTTARRRATLEGRGLTVSGEQTILYDDIVVATERIGCRR